jgi:hypothetical protein
MLKFSFDLWGYPWWIWLSAYIFPGIIYVSYHLLKEYQNRPSQFARDMLATISKKRSIKDFLGDSLIYFIAAIFILGGWLAFAVWAYFKSRQDAALEIESKKPYFNCAKKFLITKVNPRDAEINGYVIDPLGFVPDVPFGHLNKAWEHFLYEIVDPADELWSFHIEKGRKYGKYGFAAKTDIRGYAHVRSGEILGELITESD